MRLISTEPDLETVARRIIAGEIDLQPDFQRGEVWSTAKKQKLIDTVLRQWHVPPIHVIFDDATGKQEVLDGQQRLTAIRDFFLGELRINGNLEPIDPEIVALHGLTYFGLPERYRLAINNYPLRVIRLVEFTPEEPSELFFRLNQQASLNAAEQRNALFGPARKQVRDLVDQLIDSSMATFAGFSNVRMSYDDVVARLLSVLESGSLRHKVTAGTLASKYRSKEGFTQASVDMGARACALAARAAHYTVPPIGLNKATLFSWLWFAAAFAESSDAEQAQDADRMAEIAEVLGGYWSLFEALRRNKVERAPSAHRGDEGRSLNTINQLLDIYDDRSTARVADVSSVVLRDIVIWLVFAETMKHQQQLPRTASARMYAATKLLDVYQRTPMPDERLFELATGEFGWGDQRQ